MIVVTLTIEEAKDTLCKLANEIDIYQDQTTNECFITFLKLYDSIIADEPNYEPQTTLIKKVIDLLIE